ncbi:MAG: GTPase HflX [Bacteroidota bacterium]
MAQELAILVGVEWAGPNGRSAGGALDELAALAETAGAEVVARVTQRRERPDPAYFVGIGKAKELAGEASAHGAGLIVMDEELSPAQLRNLEEITGVKVVDRTGLILDIFAQRARTREAKLQVELAQLSYLLPRLGGRGVELSRLGGGIGTRGPGETKLEADRQRLRRRMFELRRELVAVKAQRDLMRRPRLRAGIPTVALVGYTNAGKSTLFNALTSGGSQAEDKLFATLDPTLRQLSLPGRREAVLADTVGFIRKLPHQLVAAFRATLEEVVQADLLLHVLDAGAPDLAAQATAVQSVLNELGVGDHPVLLALNKADLLDEADRALRGREFPQALLISAATGEGLDGLCQAMADRFAARRVTCRLLLPFAAAGILSRLHENAAVLKEEYRPDGVLVEAEIDRTEAERLKDYRFDKIGGALGGR